MENYVIVFFDKTTKYVTKEQADFIMAQSGNSELKGITIGKSYYKFSGISKIQELDEYYAENPDERPITPTVFQEYYNGTREYEPVERTAEQYKDMFSGLLKGLKKFIDEELGKKITPKNAIAFYTNKLDKYKLKFASNQELQNIAKDFGGEII